MIKTTIAAAALLVFANTADGLTFRQQPSSDPSRLLVYVDGEIVTGDAQHFSQYLGTLTKPVYGTVLNSPGGLVSEGTQIAEIIHNGNMATVVQTNAQCSSACFLMFAAGNERYASTAAHLGVHSVGDNDHKEDVTSMGLTTEIAREYARYNVPPAIIGKMVSTPSRSGTWLTAADLGTWAVVVPPAAPAPVAAAPPATPILEQGGPWPQPSGVAPIAAVTPPAPAPVTVAYIDGSRDRAAWETWFAGLSGQVKDGAEYWAAHRSLPVPGDCGRPTTMEQAAWSTGCLAARLKLNPTDQRRHADPEYKRGWNDWT